MSSRQTPNPAADREDSQTGRGGYNKLRTDPKANPNPNPHGGKREQAHTTTTVAVSGHDLTKYLTREKQYAGLDPMQRFLREGASGLQRGSSRSADKGHRL